MREGGRHRGWAMFFDWLVVFHVHTLSFIRTSLLESNLIYSWGKQRIVSIMFWVFMYDKIIAQRVKILNFNNQTLLQLIFSTTRRLLHVFQQTKMCRCFSYAIGRTKLFNQKLELKIQNSILSDNTFWNIFNRNCSWVFSIKRTLTSHARIKLFF